MSWFRRILVFSTACLGLLINARCAKGTNSTSLASRAVDAYCPILPSASFSPNVTVSGQGIYEYRVNGNGAASDSGINFTVTSAATVAVRTYSMVIDGATYSVQSSLTGSAGQVDVVTKLTSAINANSSSGLHAYGVSQLTVTKPGSLTNPSIGALTLLTQGTTNPGPRPARRVEIAVKNASGTIVQCAETLTDGTFQFELPANTGPYTIEMRSRSNNSSSRAYVLDSPGNNLQHAVAAAIDSNANIAGILLRARVHGDLAGGAFNILDQVLNAQDYLRAATSQCDQVGQPNYFSGCLPFTSAPLLRIYWAPGVSPGIYVGATGSISYYLNGRRELYLQGGANGNVTSSDMDQFDNSIILHEYAHFIEDVYGAPNSPGGAHNGDSIIDPRLAWGEGWANFFQAAVTGVAIYRDSYGTPDCTSSCAGAYFNEDLDPAGLPNIDAPLQGALGEGNFREFSITRMLWDTIKPTGGATVFAELWRIFVDPTAGMKVLADPFKSVGTFHATQMASTGASNWSALRLHEEQYPGKLFYGNTFQLSPATCTSSPVSLTPNRQPGDFGDFSTSDQMRNNDFYRFEHTGGNVQFQLFYQKPSANAPDLDIYIYRPNYVYGKASDILLASAQSGDGCPASGLSSANNPFQGLNGCPALPPGLSSPYGYERVSGALSAGTYMINVMADTAVRTGSATQYVLFINGQVVCPSP